MQGEAYYNPDYGLQTKTTCIQLNNVHKASNPFRGHAIASFGLHLFWLFRNTSKNTIFHFGYLSGKILGLTSKRNRDPKKKKKKKKLKILTTLIFKIYLESLSSL